jgi:hypothetical protein
MDMTENHPDPITNVFDPICWAAPRKIRWRPRYYVLPDINVAFSFWSGVVTKENIDQLLDMGDLLMHAENVEGFLYFSALLRVAVPYNNGKPDFSSQATQLATIGKWEQRNGNEIRTSFIAFIPGKDRFPLESPLYTKTRRSSEKTYSIIKKYWAPGRDKHDGS